jgi:hypothetical protein
MIANSDQYLEWDAESFVNVMLNDDSCDGLISTFIKEDPDTKWSYAKLDSNGRVTEVQEKVSPRQAITRGPY